MGWWFRGFSFFPFLFVCYAEVLVSPSWAKKTRQNGATKNKKTRVRNRKWRKIYFRENETREIWSQEADLYVRRYFSSSRNLFLYSFFFSPSRSLVISFQSWLFYQRIFPPVLNRFFQKCGRKKKEERTKERMDGLTLPNSGPSFYLHLLKGVVERLERPLRLSRDETVSQLNCTAQNLTGPFANADCAPLISGLVFAEIILLPVLVFLVMSIAFYVWKKYYFSALNLNLSIDPQDESPLETPV